MYWLVIGAVAVAWMVARHGDVPQPAVAVRAPAPHVTAGERWNRATGTERLALVATALGKVVWVGLLMVILVAVTIGTATWMY
jgi:hypothetical protein